LVNSVVDFKLSSTIDHTNAGFKISVLLSVAVDLPPRF